MDPNLLWLNIMYSPISNTSRKYYKKRYYKKPTNKHISTYIYKAVSAFCFKLTNNSHLLLTAYWVDDMCIAIHIKAEWQELGRNYKELEVKAEKNSEWLGKLKFPWRQE